MARYRPLLFYYLGWMALRLFATSETSKKLEVENGRTFATLYRMNKALTLASLLLIFLADCGTPEYRYVPVSNQIGPGSRMSEAVYSIPFHSPQGTIRISSTGIVDMKSKEKDAPSLPVLHLHMTVSHQNGAPDWSVFAPNQLIVFPDQGKIAPTFISSNSKTLPTVQIPTGDTRVIDFYYQLPPMDKSAQDISEFEFRWKIQTPSGLIAGSAPFDRIPIPVNRTVVYPYGPLVIGVDTGTAWWGPPIWPR